jgi:radical SAM protein with 4Fe4S-binding SPASM domain
MDRENAPRQAVIEITNGCNLRCAHCASTSGTPRADELSLAEWLGLIAELAELGCREVTLIGGEPLLHPDWPLIAAAVRAEGMELVLVTNGLLLARPAVRDALVELEPAVVGVSLDGPGPAQYGQTRGVDGFALVFDAMIALAARLPGRVTAITTFTRSNLAWFPDFVELMDGTGITWQVQAATKGGERFDDAEFLTLEDYAWLAQRMREVWTQRREGVRLRHMDSFGYFPIDPKLRFLHQTWRGCQAGLSAVGVRSDGRVTPCLALPTAFDLGSLRQESLGEIWAAHDRWERLRHKERHLEGECARCPHAAVCRAGCSALAWSATGDLRENPYCVRRIEVQTILDRIP